MLSLFLAAALAAPPGPATEPAYRGTPRYLALSFAADGSDRVWLALDGDTLHVDRNGNGDLIDPGEAVAKSIGDDAPKSATYFEVDALTAGGRTHRRLYVYLSPLKEYAEGAYAQRPELKAALARDPQGFAARVWVDADRPGLPGGGLGGRAQFGAGPFDVAGPLLFAASPADAPVVRVGGPLEVTFYGERPEWQAGRTCDAVLCVGSPGVGPGAFAALDYEGCVPAAAYPVVEVALPGPPPFRERHALKQRC